MKIINKNENDPSTIDIEVIRTAFIIIFIYERYFKHLKHK